MSENCGKPNKVTFKPKETVVSTCNDQEANSSFNCNDCRHIFEAVNPSTTWIIVHTLNSYPSVTILDDSGNEILAGIKYISSSRIEIHFNIPVKGRALLN